jgi:hypothetical protein
LPQKHHVLAAHLSHCGFFVHGNVSGSRVFVRIYCHLGRVRTTPRGRALQAWGFSFFGFFSGFLGLGFRQLSAKNP